MRPVLRFSAPIVIAIAVLSLFLSPWAINKRNEYQKRMDNRNDVARVSPGEFKESSRGDRVFFVESISGAAGEADRVGNVFISSMQNGRQGVIAAAQGHTEVAENGDKFVVLTNGRRYEAAAGTAEYRVMEFSRYLLRTETVESQGGGMQTTQSIATWDLMRNPSSTNLGELLWRIGVPLSALTLSLLAIPLSFVNPRAGRTNNLLFALLTFMIYSNLLSVSRAWVAQGRMPFEVGVWAVHLLMFMTLLLLFWNRLSVFSIWRSRR
jgi:lipopolysaccharide export system permease protein